jgi:tetratricopeptide (TPR) repeat protein
MLSGFFDLNINFSKIPQSMRMPFMIKKDCSRSENPLLRVAAGLFAMVVISACSNKKTDDELQKIEKNLIKPSGITIDYPSDSTIFPPEIPAPRFIWKDDNNKTEQWYIRLSAPNGNKIYSGIVKSSEWRPDSATWVNLKARSEHGQVLFAVAGTGKGTQGRKYSTGKVSFCFSADSAGGTIFYRAVPLPFGYAVKHVNEIEWYTGNISGGKPVRILKNIPVCANCHSFSRTGLIAMDIDYANDKGSYIIAPLKDTVNLSPDRIITWCDYKREDGTTTYGLLSQISPDGRYVLSTVKDRSVFVALDNLEYSQLFFPIKGIIAVYDRNNRRFYELPGASEKQYVQSNPNWSPDGSEVLFARTDRYMNPRIEKSESVLLDLNDVKEFTTKQKEFKFDIFRVPFNEGKGGLAIPVDGGSGNNKSNFFARYSPDGKWIVFCQAENFMLLQPDSKLYIMPAGGGTPRLMKCNTDNMNSWHSWSSNSKWLVFSSKKRGPYTQLYLTHIDENGKDSPPVFLENLAFEKRAANIPEFFDNRVYKLSNMTDDFSDNAMYHNRLATQSIRQHEYSDALNGLKKAIEADSTYYDAYKNQFYLNLIMGRAKSKEDMKYREIARQLIERQIRENPEDRSLLLKRGELRLLMEDYEGALRDGQDYIKTNNKNFQAYELIATTYQKTGEPRKAVPFLKKMQALQPGNFQIPFTLATLYKNNKQPEESLKLLNELIAKNPDEASFYISRADLYLKEGRITDARADYDKAVTVDPENYVAFKERSLFLAYNSSPDQAKKDFDRAIELLREKIKDNPQDATSMTELAEIMEQTGNIKGALAEYTGYLKLWPLNYSVLKKVGQINYSMKQWPQAIKAYTEIIDNFSAEPKILLSRSLAFQQSGNLPAALNDLNVAVSLEPKEYPYYYFRAGIRSQMGDRAGAKSDLQASYDLLKIEQSKRKLEKAESDLLSSVQKQLRNY